MKKLFFILLTFYYFGKLKTTILRPSGSFLSKRIKITEKWKSFRVLLVCRCRRLPVSGVIYRRVSVFNRGAMDTGSECAPRVGGTDEKK